MPLRSDQKAAPEAAGAPEPSSSATPACRNSRKRPSAMCLDIPEGPEEPISALLLLPAEVRNSIYSYVLPQGQTFWIHESRRHDPNCMTPPISRVNRLIRQETLTMWLSENVFGMTMLPSSAEPGIASAWLETLTPFHKFLTGLTITVTTNVQSLSGTKKKDAHIQINLKDNNLTMTILNTLMFFGGNEIDHCKAFLISRWHERQSSRLDGRDLVALTKLCAEGLNVEEARSLADASQRDKFTYTPS